MHELSIATNLVSVAEEAIARAGGPRVEAVRVRIGDLSGVVVEALEFAWDVASEGTSLAGARLDVERVRARLHCAACDRAFAVPDPPSFRCPGCGGPSARVVAGRELELTALELADDDAGEPDDGAPATAVPSDAPPSRSPASASPTSPASPFAPSSPPPPSPLGANP